MLWPVNGRKFRGDNTGKSINKNSCRFGRDKVKHQRRPRSNGMIVSFVAGIVRAFCSIRTSSLTSGDNSEYEFFGSFRKCPKQHGRFRRKTKMLRASITTTRVNVFFKRETK